MVHKRKLLQNSHLVFFSIKNCKCDRNLEFSDLLNKNALLQLSNTQSKIASLRVPSGAREERGSNASVPLTTENQTVVRLIPNKTENDK